MGEGENKMSNKFHWQKEDYFPYLIKTFKQSVLALEYLVDDLHIDKEQTIEKFLAHCGSEDFLWGIVKLMSSENLRVSGNSAYVFGTIGETSDGIDRIVGLLVNKTHPEAIKILSYLVNLLRSSDYECLMNAAGTIGTISESNMGRTWLLAQSLLTEIIELSTGLLDNTNIWVSSNAALVIARISIEDIGCEKILTHSISQQILKKLIDSLGCDNAGRGMNCAFAIGRICDHDNGRLAILKFCNTKKLIDVLSTMIEQNVDNGCTKNACYALSTLASNHQAHQVIVEHNMFNHLLNVLCKLVVTATDTETQWFAAMVLRIFSGFPSGAIKMKGMSFIGKTLSDLIKQEDLFVDVREEITIILETLKPLEKPNPVIVEVKSANEIHCEWEKLSTKNKITIRYLLFKDAECIYSGPANCFKVENLIPSTIYTFTVQNMTVENAEKSPMSEPVQALTLEIPPSEPTNFRVLGASTTLVRVAWDPPEKQNGILKNYFIYNGDTFVEQTSELTSTITGLQSATGYDLFVCASNNAGKSEKASLRAVTCDIGDTLPDKPWFAMVNKREIRVHWAPPQVIAGKLNRYDLNCNGKCVYSGVALDCQVGMLKPDTEYKFEIVAITSEGKCRSKIAKVRTLKDEYDPERQPLYPGAAIAALNRERTEINNERKKSISREQLNKNSPPLMLFRQKTRPKLLKQRLSEDYANNSNHNFQQRLTASCMENNFVEEISTNQYVISQLNKPSSSYKSNENDFFHKGKISFLDRNALQRAAAADKNRHTSKNSNHPQMLKRANTLHNFNSNKQILQKSFCLNVKDFTPKFPLLGMTVPSSTNNQPFQFNETNSNHPSSFSLNQNLNEMSAMKSENNEHSNKAPNMRAINDMPVQYSYLIKTLNKEKTLQMKI